MCSVDQLDAVLRCWLSTQEKTTIVLALLHAIKTSGNVFYNGLAINEMPLHVLRSKITVNPQQPELSFEVSYERTWTRLRNATMPSWITRYAHCTYITLMIYTSGMINKNLHKTKPASVSILWSKVVVRISPWANVKLSRLREPLFAKASWLSWTKRQPQ